VWPQGSKQLLSCHLPLVLVLVMLARQLQSMQLLLVLQRGLLLLFLGRVLLGQALRTAGSRQNNSSSSREWCWNCWKVSTALQAKETG
jgi:hypothetical protein